MDKMETLINDFIDEVQNSVYKDSIGLIGYDFDESSETYFMYHTNQYLEKQVEFNRYIGQLLSKHFFEKGIFNVVFNYDYDKTLSIDTSISVYDSVSLEYMPIRFEGFENSFNFFSFSEQERGMVA